MLSSKEGVSTDVSICMYTCLLECMYVCVSVYMYVCMRACVTYVPGRRDEGMPKWTRDHYCVNVNGRILSLDFQNICAQTF